MKVSVIFLKTHTIFNLAFIKKQQPAWKIHRTVPKYAFFAIFGHKKNLPQLSGREQAYS
jgi:hypothetical protein